MKQSTRLKQYLGKFAQGDAVHKLNKLCEFSNSDERKRCGFEKWLQFELLLFFNAQKGLTASVEAMASTDGRSTDKTHFQIDIVVTFNKSGETIGLELKTRLKAASSIQALQKDIKKFSKTKTKDKSTGNFAVVLCAENFDDERKQKLIKEHASDPNGFDIVDVGKYHFFVAEAA